MKITIVSSRRSLLSRASATPARRAAALDRLADLHLLLGLFAEAREANAALLAHSPRDPDALRRALWLQLRAFPEGDMQELASFSVPEARQMLIAPHDPGNVPAIEKAIMKADLGLTPSSD